MIKKHYPGWSSPPLEVKGHDGRNLARLSRGEVPEYLRERFNPFCHQCQTEHPIRFTCADWLQVTEHNSRSESNTPGGPALAALEPKGKADNHAPGQPEKVRAWEALLNSEPRHSKGHGPTGPEVPKPRNKKPQQIEIPKKGYKLFGVPTVQTEFAFCHVAKETNCTQNGSGAGE